MKIVYMGTPDFAVAPLEALLESPAHEVVLAVTQPDKPKGRGKQLQITPVKAVAQRHGIPVAQPDKIRNNEEFLAALRQLAPDLIVVAAFGQILPETVLNCPKYGCINVHASLLPKYRGAAPIQRAILNGEEKTGITIMQMAKGLDTGDIISQRELTLSPDETGGSLFERLAQLSKPLLLETIEAIGNGTAVRTPQEEMEASYAAMLSKETGRLDWTASAAQLERYVRGCNPWPGTYTTLDGHMIKIWKSRVAPASEIPKGVQNAACGAVFVSGRNTLLVCTGDGLLEILELQAEGRKRMDTAAFLRGCRLPEQAVFLT